MKKTVVILTIILFFLVALYESLIIGDLNTKLRTAETVIGHQMDKLDKQKPVGDLQEEVKFLKKQLNIQCEAEEKRVANMRKEFNDSRDFCLKDLETMLERARENEVMVGLYPLQKTLRDMNKHGEKLEERVKFLELQMKEMDRLVTQLRLK